MHILLYLYMCIYIYIYSYIHTRVCSVKFCWSKWCVSSFCFFNSAFVLNLETSRGKGFVWVGPMRILLVSTPVFTTMIFMIFGLMMIDYIFWVGSLNFHEIQWTSPLHPPSAVPLFVTRRRCGLEDTQPIPASLRAAALLSFEGEKVPELAVPFFCGFVAFKNSGNTFW